jgi:DNA polymerase-1
VSERILLVDADTAVFRFAYVNEEAHAWDSETWSYFGDLGRAKQQLGKWIDDLLVRLDADQVYYFLSDSEANWRHDILPSYKGHRASWRQGRRPSLGELPDVPEGPRRPMLYKPLREWLRETFDAVVIPSLEADDLCGMWATNPAFGGEKIIVSVDKDLRQVPGLHWNPDRSEEGITRVSEREGDYCHLYLTLVGDTSDGYSGCKGIGPVKAKKLLDDSCSWATVVRAYKGAGLTEEDALVQARVARVCRHGDYNPETKEIKLWEPTS